MYMQTLYMLHYGWQSPIQCQFVLLAMVSVSLYADPHERAQDMIFAYQRECNNMKVKPVTKLLEQLEVCIYMYVIHKYV